MVNNKYFQFSGRITGTTFFFRNTLANILLYLAGFTYGLGKEASNTALLLGVGMFFLAVWYSLATIYKRANSIDPGNENLWTMALFLIGCAELLVESIGAWSKGLLVIITLIFIFSNGKTDDGVLRG